MQPLDGLTELENIFGCRQDTQLGEKLRRTFLSRKQKIFFRAWKAWAYSKQQEDCYKARYKKGFNLFSSVDP